MPRYRIDAAIAVGDGSGRTIDLSSNSVYFETADRFAPGDELALVFPFEHTGTGAAVRCMGYVVRVDPRGDLFGIAATYEPVAFSVSA
ncbi:MAG TPA: PilZ domain-containing protein [Vicinamibacterales bacterium]|nr:PilZ domain-containing protein [Vicinamibacterales bacterium]